MHTQFDSKHAEANELLSKARDHLAVGDASSALHTLVQALQRLDISPQAQQAAVCQCAPACAMLAPALPGDTTRPDAEQGELLVAEMVMACADRVRQSLVGQPAEQGHAVQQLTGLLAACTLYTRQVRHGQLTLRTCFAVADLTYNTRMYIIMLRTLLLYESIAGVRWDFAFTASSALCCNSKA